MIKQTHLTQTIISWALVLVFGIILAAVTTMRPANAACNSERCQAAQAALSEANAKRAEANNQAATWEEKKSQIEAEIAAIEAQIAVTQATVDDLQGQIADATKKLATNRQALASLLINMHSDASNDAHVSTIMLLAGSTSISDLAERRSRQITVKTQIALAAESVKRAKAELEDKKLESENLLSQQQMQQAYADDKRAEAAALVAKYENDAESYAKDAASAQATIAAEMAAEAQRYGGGLSAASTSGFNNYIYEDVCPGMGDYFANNLIANYDNRGVYGGVVCQCTGYAGWKAYVATGGALRISGWGNAISWGSTATRLGYSVNYTPTAGSIAVQEWGTYGHVMWVESVNESAGTAYISEYNYIPYSFSTRVINYHTAGYRYIHI